MAAEKPKRDAHPYLMYDMLLSQPDAVARVLKEERAGVEKFVDEVSKKFGSSTRNTIHFVGIGTSWHGTLIAEQFGRLVSGVDCRSWHSFEFSSYLPSLSPDKDVVVILAHRGTKHFSTAALQDAKRLGLLTALVTSIDSKPEVLADHVFRTCHSEQSSAYTVSLTCAITMCAMISTFLGIKNGSQEAAALEKQLHELPGLMDQAIKMTEETAKKAANAYRGSTNYFVGYGINTAVALETALKIKETSYSPCEGFQLEQFLHGPFCAVYDTTTTTYIISDSSYITQNRARMMVKASQPVAKSVTVICPSDDLATLSLLRSEVDFAIKVPRVSEQLSPWVNLVAVQLFTYWLAVAMGTNPDPFRLNDPKHVEASKFWNLYGLEEKKQ